MVKAATFKEFNAIVRYARHAHEKSDYSDIQFNTVVFRDSLRKCLSSPVHKVFVAMQGDEVCGLLIGYVDQMIQSKALYATDVEFVAEKHGDKLLDAFVEWAESMNVKRIFCAVSNDNQRPQKIIDRYYKMRKFSRPSGAIYVRKY